ncbi:MAG: DUF3667 domain-containing protein [Gemmatimonadota bacterium]|jgi:hypothetical protein
MSESSRGAHPRLTIRHVLADAYRAILALDSPLLRVIRDLTLRPGQFVRRYVEGEREGVVGPIKYALLTLTVSVIAGQLGRKLYPLELGPRDDAAWIEALYAASDLRTYWALPVLIPTAMLQRLLFWRRGFNLAETYVFLAYVMGHFFWLWVVGALLPKDIRDQTLISVLSSVIPCVYVAWAYCGFYGRRSLSVVVRGLIVFMTFLFGIAISISIVAGLQTMRR